MSNFTDFINNLATGDNRVTPLPPTGQASMPASPAVRQTATRPAPLGNMPGQDSMSDFQAAAQRAVDAIMKPKG